MAPLRKAAKGSEFMPVSEDQMKRLGAAIMSRDPEGRSEAVFLARFLSFFGVDPAVAVEVWDMLEVPFFDLDGDLNGALPKHLLWALLFLKKHGDESEMATLAGGSDGAIDEKTFRKWQTIFVNRIASLKHDVASVASFVVCCSCCFDATDHHFGLFLNRSFGRTGKLVMLGMTV